MTNEDKLLTGIKKRRRGSLEKAIDIYTPYVSVVVYNTIGTSMTKEDIEEVVSDVFISLWKSAESLDSEKGSLRTYLGAVARNCAINKLRQLSFCEELSDSVVSELKSPDDTMAEAENRTMLLGLIKNLGEPDTEIFLRYYWYDESVSKISAVTGICRSTITTKLLRGRQKLKKNLTEGMYGNEQKT